MSKPLVVAAAIVDDLARPTRLLGARRSAPKSLAGRWEFPGGKVEPGEADLDALHRELEEELGVTATIGAPVPAPGGGDWPITKGYWMRLWFASIDREPEPLLDHDELRWLTVEQLTTVPWLDADLPIVEVVGAALQPSV
ncbi:(deoxy)nucleoside triphosphate pyrophosphohydrolase [Pseudactinotalea sp.]|uniref:(deoxy)nucleoside triphosphate pyrophosphohydrolase n=1 Tax=Pseudactinotalea sp. TaxID=1926260 RepID=UPI003B3A9C1C